MKLTLVAAGRLKAGPERDLYDRYAKRLDGIGRQIGLGPLSVSEVRESRAPSADERRSQEARALSAKIPGGAHLVALDVGGERLSSEAFAKFLNDLRDSAVADLAIVIGGPDGLGALEVDAPCRRLSLGALTLPHGLARVVIAEQLYRAATLIAGHPYHRD